MGRRLGFEPAAQRPGQERVERLGEFVGADVRDRCLADKMRGEPFLNGGPQGLIGQIGPFLPFGAPEEHHALAPLRERVRPGQR
jgi:hypothetical protein